MSTRTEKFQKKPLGPQDTKKEEPQGSEEEIVKFSPEEEAVISLALLRTNGN